MLEHMPRKAVTIPADLAARLRHEAERQGVTVAELTRAAIAAFLPPERKRRLLAGAAGASGRSDISERIEQILAGDSRR